MPHNRPGYMREYFQQRRARGLCVRCGQPSEKYSRCLLCRVDYRQQQAKYERQYRRKHQRDINARARERYQTSKRNSDNDATVTA